MEDLPEQNFRPECRVCWIQVEYRGRKLTIGNHIYRIADIAHDIGTKLKQTLNNMFLGDDSNSVWGIILGIEGVDTSQLIVKTSFGEGFLTELQLQSSFRDGIRFVINQPARKKTG